MQIHELSAPTSVKLQEACVREVMKQESFFVVSTNHTVKKAHMATWVLTAHGGVSVMIPVSVGAWPCAREAKPTTEATKILSCREYWFIAADW